MCCPGLMQAGHWEAVSSPLGLVSNIVNFICHLITSVGYYSLLLSSARQILLVPLLWALDMAQGQQAQAAPRGKRRCALTFLQPSSASCLLGPPTQLPSFLPKHCLPGVLTDGLALTPYSWLQPQLPHPSGPRSVLPPACPPPPHCGICPLLTEAVLTLRAATLQVHATYTVMHGGCLATQGSACPSLPPRWASDLDWEVKGVISCLVPVITLMYYLAPQKR